MIRLLLRCYPARWRSRYGDEFVALLAERPLGPYDVADVLFGALDAHLHLRGLGGAPEGGRWLGVSSRIGGWAGTGAGLLWILALLGSAWALALGGTVLLLVALVALSAFQARREPLAVWTAFIVAAGGGGASLAGLVGMGAIGHGSVLGIASGWDVWNLGMVALSAGSALFAGATLRTRSLPRSAAVLLLVCSLVSGIAMLAVVSPVGLAVGLQEGDVRLLIHAAMAAFATGWVGLGVAALRADSRPLIPAAGTARSPMPGALPLGPPPRSGT